MVVINSIHQLEHSLKLFPQTWTKIYVLVDNNTQEYCLPALFQNIDFFKSAEIIEIDSGEESKNIEICIQIWLFLQETNADRNALIVNLGGGVICDLGGFIASTYKRGIDFINIPTTLLAQVDASVGGKTGVNLNEVKNQIGVFSNPILTFVDSHFLATLPKREFNSGIAEVLKYGIIEDTKILDILTTKNIKNQIPLLIDKCLKIKEYIVKEDFKEKGERKKLNFGHTIGHAIESLFYGKILHGEAVAIGLICESYIATKITGLTLQDLQKIEQLVFRYFNKIKIDKNQIPKLLAYMKHDKKNMDDNVNFTLITKPGKTKTDYFISSQLVQESLTYYTLLSPIQ